MLNPFFKNFGPFRIEKLITVLGIKNDQNFQSFEREFDDSLSLESFCIKKEHQNSQHLKALESIANASSDLRDKVTKVQAEAKTARDNIREGLPKSK